MNRSIEQALTSIIPRHNGALPPELVELASSLLAQSRNKASNLKAEEEIGRTYACANIACERLKASLNLPKIEPRPPCPPRVYKKLYTYLDSALVTTRKRARNEHSQSQSNTPSKLQATPSKASLIALHDAPETQTPVRTQAASAEERIAGSIRPGNQKGVDKFKSNRTPRKGLKYQSNKERDERVPLWVLPTIRFLCRELEAPAAVPHILAGVESVLTIPCPGPEDEEPASKKRKGKRKSTGEDQDEEKKRMEGKLPALIGAVFSFVKVRLEAKETTGQAYAAQRLQVLEILGRVRSDEGIIEKIGEDEEAWREWDDVDKKNIDEWLMEISNNGWLRLDWFENIVEGGGLTGNGHDGTGADEYQIKEEKKVMRSGLGTMIHDKVDYLSDDNRVKFAEWKKLVLEKVEQILDQRISNGEVEL